MGKSLVSPAFHAFIYLKNEKPFRLQHQQTIQPYSKQTWHSLRFTTPSPHEPSNLANLSNLNNPKLNLEERQLMLRPQEALTIMVFFKWL